MPLAFIDLWKFQNWICMYTKLIKIIYMVGNGKIYNFTTHCSFYGLCDFTRQFCSIAQYTDTHNTGEKYNLNIQLLLLYNLWFYQTVL